MLPPAGRMNPKAAFQSQKLDRNPLCRPLASQSLGEMHSSPRSMCMSILGQCSPILSTNNSHVWSKPCLRFSSAAQQARKEDWMPSLDPGSWQCELRYWLYSCQHDCAFSPHNRNSLLFFTSSFVTTSLSVRSSWSTLMPDSDRTLACSSDRTAAMTRACLTSGTLLDSKSATTEPPL